MKGDRDDRSGHRRNTLATANNAVRTTGRPFSNENMQTSGTLSPNVNTLGSQYSSLVTTPNVDTSFANDAFSHAFGNIFNLPEQDRHFHQAPESISHASDQVIYKYKNVKSDPIGCEHDLSSGGPLDDGVGFDLTPLRGKDVLHGQNGPANDQSATRQTSFASQSWTLNSNKVEYSSSPEGTPLRNDQMKATMNSTSGQSPVSRIGMVPESTYLSPLKSQSTSQHDIVLPTLPSQSRQVNHNFEDLQSLASAQANRKNVRAHTSEGIPIHNLRFLLGDPAHLLGTSVEPECEGDASKEQLAEELEAYKERTRQLEEHIASLTVALNDQTRESHPSAAIQHNAQPKIRYEPQQMAKLMAEFSPGGLSSVGSAPSLTMSPDPFSPFRLSTPSPQLHPQHDAMNSMNAKWPTGFPHDSRPKAQPPTSSMLRFISHASSNETSVEKADSRISGSSTSVAEKTYMNGLRMNLSGSDAQDPNAVHQRLFNDNLATSEMATYNQSHQDVTSANDAHTSGVLQSPFQQSTMLPLSHAALNSPYLAAYTPGSSRMSGPNNNIDDRSARFHGSDTQTSPEAMVLRALGSRNQEASITLQQQLKTSSPTRRNALIGAIAPHLLKLADDKHGNFLAQRAISVEPQLAWQLQGRFVALSLSQFGCHVVQKLLDEEESVRKAVVTELLADRVLETLTCKNSIHIWQKVLELQWSDGGEMRSSIFSTVNATMKGKWADTAMLETGSIICQNIFESADENEKHDCLDEILLRLGECASNQWGVWVVQHIIEHSEQETKKIAFQQLLRDAPPLTLSQYGQKAIMSALKSRDPEFVAAYIDVLCDRFTPAGSAGTQSSTSGSGRRSVLVDVSTAPQGVQIITQLLTSVTPEQRERIIKTVRKNSVFLKGSKAGLRVHQLCERARAFTGY